MSILVPELVAAMLCAPLCAAGQLPEIDLFRPTGLPQRLAVAPEALTGLRAQHGPFLLRAVDTPRGRLDLTLERFDVLSPNARFAVGLDARPLPLPEVVFLRGSVAGDASAHVFLALGQRAFGRIERPGLPATLLSGRLDAHGGEVVFFEARPAAPDAPPVPVCGVTGPAGKDPHAGAAPRRGDASRLPGAARESAPAGGPRQAAGSPQPPLPGLQELELAVDTDVEFYELFGDLDAAAEYVAMLYGAISDLYMRDVNTRLELTFVQLRDEQADELPYHQNENPLPGLQSYWNANQAGVPRDVVQFLTGRRDLPYGGVAYISSLCNSSAYSVAGFILGELPDPQQPSGRLWDFIVAAHELGHNCGTGHTHDYGIDSCAFGGLQRGTIMSYCHTLSGGNGNIDPLFDTFVRQVMKDYIFSRDCIDDDCNGNGTEDAADILLGLSTDANSDDVPDECQDCDGDGLRDDLEILQGAADANANGLPDSCEPDCNANSVPDDRDIQLGTSQDLYLNGVPDECQTDCDRNSVADYNQIQADMGLDVNRDARLDTCEDCDGDGLNDLQTLDGAHDLWIGSSAGVLARFHATSGVRVVVGSVPDEAIFRDLRVTADGDVLAIDLAQNSVIKLDRNGSNLQHFIGSGVGGLFLPEAMTFSPAGTLLVCSGGSSTVLEFTAAGSFIREMVAAGAGGLSWPTGAVFGPDGQLYVSSRDTDSVLKYDGVTGAPLGAFVTTGAAGLSTPRGLLFKEDGNLLVASSGSNAILEYDGRSGAFVGRFDKGGQAEGFWFLSEPWALRRGPNGHVFVSSHQGNAAVHMYHAATGAFMRSFYVLGAPDMPSPTGFDFVAGDLADCNINGEPDACDILSGGSTDLNGDGRPDECPASGCNVADCADADGDGVRDDNCVYWSCQGAACVGTPIGFGDMGGEFGACMADGSTDGHDRFHALNCFSNQGTLGTPGYPCEAAPPAAYNVDAGGPFGSCAPDGVCDGNDAFHALNTFDGSSTCTCPSDP
jgi:sugar lactone lactonase YvrE